MVSHAGAGGVRPFLQLLEVQALRGAADRDLLGRVAAADEAAFRVVAERHGPMVFGVCARLLGNRHDAEDALQATFLVLARRAAGVRKSESLASWLHGVARRVALRLRRADRRRAARERATAVADAHAPADALAWAEVRAGLDEELARLPAAYRDVLVLCYLEGLSRDEAAQRLGLDAGAVKGRLERGRRLLGERLVKRGIGLSAGLAGLAVAPDATAALRLGRLVSNPAAASPRAAALTHEFLKGVAMSKFKLVTAGVLALAVGVGVGTAQPPTPAKEAPPRPRGEIPLGKFGAAPDKDTDEAFIRRVSKDLRGTDPTPAELHFFLASKDANKRSTLVDLFVKERAVKDFGQAAKLGERIEDLARKFGERTDPKAEADAIRRYAEAVQLAHAREQEARALAEKAVAERDVQARRAVERAVEAERAARDAIEAQRREVLRAAEAERERERAEAERE
ncbi:MAG TPA: sigma-70 family RNA polymerase sigma factor, partial [Urbifossiella sp.]|nr:sigma-70 family RNA polymerase sigma factor [Urbifossiella sp.]